MSTEKTERYLCLGVGGMGMAPLSAWLAQSGAEVWGNDDNLQVGVRRILESSGVVIKDFIFVEQLEGFTTVVYSSAIQAEHPLLQAARARGIRTLRRGELLAEVSKSKRLIAVAGSHGKTTTSGMIVHILRTHYVSVNYILGGLFDAAEVAPSRYVAESDWLIAEVDESDGTIEHFEPAVTVLLNTDWDHADRYTQASDTKAAFKGLLQRTQEVFFLPEAESEIALSLPEGLECVRYGVTGDYTAEVGTDGILQLGGRFVPTELAPPKFGRLNQHNALAALCVCQRFVETFSRNALSTFPGMLRRQSILLQKPDLVVVEDYAHHPTEIVALMDGLKEMYPGNRLVVVFQGHRYSRTKQFKSAFAEALSAADACFLLPIYAAHEKALVGGLTEDLQGAFDVGSVEVLSMDVEGMDQLNTYLPEGPKTVAFVGAGDLDQFARMFVAKNQNSDDGAAAFMEYLSGGVSEESVVRRDEPLAKKTTLRVGGAARYYAEPANLTDLRVLLQAAKLWQVPVFYLGRGSNLVVPDEGFDGLVIRFNGASWRSVEILEDGRMWVAAGARLKEVCGLAAKAGLAGFEFLEGIPGSIGGALRMNAGAMGSWMFDVVERVQYLDAAGRYQDAPKEAFHFGYRKVEEISRGVALGAIVRSADAEAEQSIRGRMDSYSTSRKASQPREPSAGCIFKNPEGNYAGKLIDVHGIKGMRVGAAEVSDIHGNFIINRGGATASDVIELVGRVREKIYADSGYLLEPEVLLVGQQWDTILGMPAGSETISKND